jgi:hypothetical protein
MRVNAFGLAAGWKLCAKMRLPGFTHMIFRARNWKPRKFRRYLSLKYMIIGNGDDRGRTDRVKRC